MAESKRDEARRPGGAIAVLLAGLFGAALLLAEPGQAVQRRAFVTSILGKGKIADWPGANGATVLEQADGVCGLLADNAEPPLPNPDGYRAWLSTSETDAYCHVQGLTGKKDESCDGAELPGAGPWFLANGLTAVTGTLDELMTPEGKIYRGFAFDENLQPVGTLFNERIYWTGTDPGGEVIATSTCGNWTSDSAVDGGSVGEAHAAAIRWTNYLPATCSIAHRLLCLESGPGTGGGVFWSPGALAFVTSARGPGNLSTWPEAGGLTGVNAGYEICQSLAEEASLPAPASFVPWLSNNFFSAAERITTDGPFRRIDGQRIAVDKDDLLDGALTAGIHQDETGAYLNDGTLLTVFTGTEIDGSLADSHCDFWTGGDESVALGGYAGYGGMPGWTSYSEFGCEFHGRLYCISNVITIFWDSFEMTGDTSRWSDAEGEAVVAP